MKNSNFTFSYTVTNYKIFDLDLNQLADLLLEEDNDTNWLMMQLGDNLTFYLYKLGLPDDAELSDQLEDYIYNSVYDKLENILNEKLKNNSFDN